MTHGTKKTKWEQRNIVAWDGEGARVFVCHLNGDIVNTHIFNLLANSRGRYISQPGHHQTLRTAHCLEFLIQEDTLSSINCIFAGGYDINMMLVDLPRESIRQLWRKGRVQWNGYKLVYRPRKWFSVSKRDPEKKGGWTRPAVLWDVFGFFQGSFVKSVRKWLKDDVDLEEIQAMKDSRSDFTPLDWDRILEYNAQECALLVLLMKALCRSLDQAGMQLTRFDGAGALATIFLRRYGVKKHMGDIPEWVYRACQQAYSGGRVETPQAGSQLTRLWKYDINSAYVGGCLSLPSWSGAVWEREPRPNDSALDYMVAIEWRLPEAPFYPLFYRTVGGEILYPSSGSGIYWSPEYRAISKHYKEGRDFEVQYAINAYGENELKPFAQVSADYAQRLLFKRQGNMAQQSYKLALASIYGKTAQQEGYVPKTAVSDARYPSYHNLAWASLITSNTRATVYEAGMESPESVVAFATDAVFSTEELRRCRIGDDLNTWTVETYDGITIVQAGVYWLLGPDGWESKYRGFDAGSLTRDTIVDTWRNGGTSVDVTLTRFVGMGTALARTNYDEVWRTWLRQNRKLDIIPKGKRQPIGRNFHDRLEPTRATDNFSDMPSAPYKVIWMDGVRQQDYDVNLRVEEEEWEDSWL